MKTGVFAPMPNEHLITPEGYPFIAVGAVLALLAIFLGFFLLFLLMAALTVFICFFFRNPKRETPDDAKTIVAPADGRIIAIEDLTHPSLGDAVKVSTFMSVLNCHINRAPVNGNVEEISYRPGRFFVASLDKASKHNEQNTIIMEDNDGRRLAIVQIAGLVARRIVCYLKEGFEVSKGSRLGLIRFGSRVDLFLPRASAKIEIKKGEVVRAGETIIGKWI